jgi:pimeloyl-ACP methyl ester carboxylesterase
MGIGIATDVLVYLNSYSWTTHPVNLPPESRPPPHAAGTQRPDLAGPRGADTGALAAPTDTPPEPEADRMPRGYWMRDRIQDRLATLMAELLANERPDRVVLVAHSQGTVIALDTIDRYGTAGGWPGACIW